MIYHHCAQCRSPIGVSYSRYCPKHLMRNWRYGSPTGRRLLADESKPYRKLIGRGMAARRGSAPVKAALETAYDLLCYSPTSSRKVYAKVQENFQRLRVGGVTPFELLEVACAVFAIELLEPHRFGSVTEANFTAAREVLKLRPMRGGKPCKELLTALGEMLRDHLALFSYALTREAMEHDTKQNRRKEVMAMGWGGD